jgi:hypothetical protein
MDTCKEGGEKGRKEGEGKGVEGREGEGGERDGRTE